MTEDGEWELVRAQGAGRAGRGARQQRQGRDLGGARLPETGEGSAEEQPGRQVGPIIGVHSRSGDEAMRTFMGTASYGAWHFTADLIPAAVVVPGTLNVPRPTSDWLGKAFREDLEPALGSAPGQPETPEGRPAGGDG